MFIKKGQIVDSRNGLKSSKISRYLRAVQNRTKTKTDPNWSKTDEND